MKQTELFYSRDIATARRIMAEELRRDPSWYQAYQANISCCIYDALRDMNRGMSMEKTNVIAHKIIRMIWNS